MDVSKYEQFCVLDICTLTFYASKLNFVFLPEGGHISDTAVFFQLHQ